MSTLKLALRDYQLRANQQLVRVLHKRPILVMPTGGGKTVTASALIKNLNARTLWIAHRRELIHQAAKTLRKLNMRTHLILAGEDNDQTLHMFGSAEAEPAPDPSSPPIYVASVQTLARRTIPAVDLVVIDECFPAGTLVDGRPIETIKVGDEVCAWDGSQIQLRTVTRIFRRVSPRKLLKITHDRGAIVCTKNHPLLVHNAGAWLPAGCVHVGDSLYVVPELLPTNAMETSKTVPAMLSSEDGRAKSTGLSSAHAGEESHVYAGRERAGQRGDEGPSSNSAGRQWQSTARATAPAGGAPGIANGTCNTYAADERIRLSDMLQSGHCRSVGDAGDRNRWRLSRAGETPTARSKERTVFILSRVDRIEVLEQGRDEGYGRLCADGFVYNLEVEELHTYTANGVIVHNCHHASADSYQDALALQNALGPVPVIGLTATPFRLDGKPLGDMFKSIVVAAHCDELVASGILHAPRVYCANGPDLSQVKISMGDFSPQDVGRAVNKPNLIGDIFKEWVLHAGPDRAGGDGRALKTICFATNVEHSKAIVAAFREFDIKAEHLDGSTPTQERDEILARLRSGETDIVSNCDVLGEGWDLPTLECAILARPTASLNKHLQQIGRIMRSADEKRHALVLDHAGNHHRHGLVTRRLEYSLEGTVKPLTAGEPLGLKRCPVCGLMVATEAEVCSDCGSKFEPQKREIKHEPGKLTEFDDSSFEYRVNAWREFQAAQDAQGFSEGWASYRFKERFGQFPVLTEAGEMVDVRNATQEQKRGVYERFVGIAEEKGFKPGWASWAYQNIFQVWPSGFVAQVKASKLNERWKATRAEVSNRF